MKKAYASVGLITSLHPIMFPSKFSVSNLDSGFAKNIKFWFENNKRILPWREDPSPYAVWVSEVMLQQTQVAVVIPYFLRWMELFPTVAHLAKASLDEVIKAWEGLGYYTRARYLHEGARYVVDHFEGNLPDAEKDLKKIKGLGPYTIGAIRSFAFKQAAVALDGNGVRVLTRYFGIYDDVTKPKTFSALNELMARLLPQEKPWVFNEALIEFGATLCRKKPLCHQCPFMTRCQAFQEGKELELPYKSKKNTIERLVRGVLVVQCKRHLLIRQVPKGEIMSDLHEFPYMPAASPIVTEKDLIDFAQAAWKIHLQLEEALPEEEHSFTRYQVKLVPYLFTVKHLEQIPAYEWLSFEALQTKAFSSGHRRIYQKLIKEGKFR